MGKKDSGDLPALNSLSDREERTALPAAPALHTSAHVHESPVSVTASSQSTADSIANAVPFRLTSSIPPLVPKVSPPSSVLQQLPSSPRTPIQTRQLLLYVCSICEEEFESRAMKPPIRHTCKGTHAGRHGIGRLLSSKITFPAASMVGMHMLPLPPYPGLLPTAMVPRMAPVSFPHLPPRPPVPTSPMADYSVHDVSSFRPPVAPSSLPSPYHSSSTTGRSRPTSPHQSTRPGVRASSQSVIVEDVPAMASLQNKDVTMIQPDRCREYSHDRAQAYRSSHSSDNDSRRGDSSGDSTEKELCDSEVRKSLGLHRSSSDSSEEGMGSDSSNKDRRRSSIMESSSSPDTHHHAKRRRSIGDSEGRAQSPFPRNSSDESSSSMDDDKEPSRPRTFLPIHASRRSPSAGDEPSLKRMCVGAGNQQSRPLSSTSFLPVLSSARQQEDQSSTPAIISGIIAELTRRDHERRAELDSLKDVLRRGEMARQKLECELLEYAGFFEKCRLDMALDMRSLRKSVELMTSKIQASCMGV